MSAAHVSPMDDLDLHTLPIEAGDTPLLVGVVGSTAYGLAHDSSDVDRLGVYARPGRDFLGLHAPPACQQTRVGHDPDIQLHEVGKFLWLASAANPTVTELLWLDRYDHLTPAGEQLVGMRGSLLSARAVRKAYLGYAAGQVKKLANTNRSNQRRREKLARHTLRLLHQGAGLWRTGRLTLQVEDPERFFAFGRAVVAGEQSLVESEFAKAEAVFDRPGVLPESPNLAVLNDWLVEYRLASMDQSTNLTVPHT